MNHHSHNSPGIDTNPTCRRVLVTPRMYDLDNVPTFSPVYDLPPLIEQNLPIIAIAAINTAGEVVRTKNNAVFTYAYNRITMNGLRNRDWQQYLEACAYHTWANVSSNEYQEPEDAINDACATVFTTFACYLAWNNAAFERLLTTGVQNEVIDTAQNWPSFQEAYKFLISEFRDTQNARTVGGTNQRITSTDIGFQVPGQRAEQRGSVGALRVTRRGTSRVTDTAPASQMRTVTSPRRQMQAPVQQPRTNPRRSHYVGIPTQAPARAPAEPPRAQFQSTMTEMVGGVANTYSISKGQSNLTFNDWQPSFSQRFHPLMKVNGEVIYDRANLANGSPAVIAINSESDNMNADDHVISTAGSMFRHSSAQHAPAESVRPDTALGVIGKAIVSGGVGENEKATQVYRSLGVSADQLKDDVGTSDSVAGFVRNVRLHRQITGAKFGNTAFFANGIIRQSFVTNESLLEPFTMLSEKLTFAEVAETLKSYLSQKLHLDEIAAIMQLDTYLRELVQTFIRLHMGQNNFKFDSFIDEVHEIPAALLSAYGKVYEQYYHNSEATLIKMALSKEALEEEQLFRGKPRPFVKIEGEPDPVQESEAAGFELSIQRYVTGLVVDLNFETFGVTTPVGVACEIFPDSFKGLYELCEGVFKSKNINQLEVHYIILADNTVFEIACSRLAAQSIGKPTYIIRRMAM